MIRGKMQICYLAHNKYTDLCFFDTEKIICDLIKLCSNNTEINIQIKRFCPNYITANIYSTIGCDRFICFCIEKDSSYISGILFIIWRLLIVNTDVSVRSSFQSSTDSGEVYPSGSQSSSAISFFFSS